MPVYKDEKRGTWYVRFKQKDWTGQTRAIWKRGFSSKREAVQWELDYKIRQKGSLNMTFAQFVDVYKQDRINRIKESTMTTKENIISIHIVPYFGAKKISDITPADIIKWQNHIMSRTDKKGKKFSKSFLKTIHNQLSAILNHAVKYYGLSSNPAQTVGNMGTDKGIEMNYLTLEEYRKLADVLMDEPVFYYAIEVLYWCGIREGELLALEAGDFDFEKKTLSITKTFQRIKGRDMITSPKTIKSRRVITVPEFLCEEIRDYINMSYGGEKLGRLFPISKSGLTIALKRALNKAGLKEIRVHDLRHSHVSLLISQGYSAVSIADRVGHESIDITYRYAHLFPSDRKEMADRLNELKG